MPNTGSGTMTPLPPPVVPAPIRDFEKWCTGAVSLAMYARHFGIGECGFWGVYNEEEKEISCHAIWSQRERQLLAHYLCEAQEEIENVIGYPLQLKWFENESHIAKSMLKLKWMKLVAGGIKAYDEIEYNSVIDHSSDPAVIGPIVTTVTDPSEIKLFWAGTLEQFEQEVTPSRIILSGGTVTIYVPRCRLVHVDYIDNPENGLDYTDTSLFWQIIDVVRVYNDVSDNGQLVVPHSCSTVCSESGCSEYAQDLCLYVRNGELGLGDIRPASYINGIWTTQSSICCRGYQTARVNYCAGDSILTYQAKDAIIRLTHAKMPIEPCACDPIKNYWERDRKEPDVLTTDRLNCPFGTSIGAWTAWQFASKGMKKLRGSAMI